MTWAARNVHIRPRPDGCRRVSSTGATLLLALLATTFSVGTSSSSCRNSRGDVVDWWVVYKLPNGLQYGYTDSTLPGDAMVPHSGTLNSTDTSAFTETLKQVYDASSSTAFVAYNDETPAGKTSASHAHAKGILLSSSSSAFWLIHSVPKLPDLTLTSFKWTASDTYGQTMLCISLSPSAANTAAEQLQIMHPLIYDSALPSSLKTTLPAFGPLINGDSPTELQRTVTLTSRGSYKFVHFAKSGDWGQHLYEDLVEPYYKQAFNWETWRRTPAMDSYCTPTYKYDSMNVAYISMGADDGETWHYTKDHAKWGASVDSSAGIVCIGDINRMSSQAQRGGGTACLTSTDLYGTMAPLISKVDGCSSTSLRHHKHKRHHEDRRRH